VALSDSQERTGRQAGLAGMAARALDRFPGDRAIMALAAELAADDLVHVNVVRAGAHFKDGGMTHLAFELNTVIPVRENDRRHPTLLGFAVQHHVAIVAGDGETGGEHEPQPDHQPQCQPHFSHRTSPHSPTVPTRATRVQAPMFVTQAEAIVNGEPCGLSVEWLTCRRQFFTLF